MVAGFGDVLPVGTFELDGLGSAPNVSTVTYLGLDPPATRLDELALALVSFINHGPPSFGIGSTFVRKQFFSYGIQYMPDLITDFVFTCRFRLCLEDVVQFRSQICGSCAGE
jgi:hypothetical protein